MCDTMRGGVATVSLNNTWGRKGVNWMEIFLDVLTEQYFFKLEFLKMSRHAEGDGDRASVTKWHMAEGGRGF